ncbi:hypothetical protein OCL06_13020 [Alteromonas sp. ASW11-19]|uniref:Lipoprotein n=1 Tax=Alteromonas salexigens TaxID=2982530 RepID=A0ABT2VQC6_9ALTE|nr:hypothetical protein [Alteromonas salexigens]MCU7555511.1 hypothetical protein [Alteromonas salexigens]
MKGLSRVAPALAMALAVLVSGCASHQGLPENAKNQFVTEFYAYVGHVREVQFESYVPEASVFGAAAGAIQSVNDTEHMFAAAIIGGALAGLVTAIAEGDRTGYEYSLHAVDGDRVLVLVEDKTALQGECVLVRVAGDVYLHPVADEACRNPYPYDYQSVPYGDNPAPTAGEI